MTVKGHRTPVSERFWPKVRKTRGCWVWTGATSRGDYGRICVGVKVRIAHRVSWEMAFGKIPKGLYVCHTCDNPRCVRPGHLFLGTNSDNQQDAKQKGRLAGPRKTHCPHGHKYTPENTTRWGKNGGRRCKKCERNRYKRRSPRDNS